MKHRLLSITAYLRLFVAAIFVLGLASCEKEVHIDLGTTAPKTVIQGQIETGMPPFVVLTSTISFFASVDLGTLQNSFLHDAIVKVSNGSKTVTLKEYAIDTGANNKFYVYTIDSSNVMLGEVGQIYSLSVTYGGNTYTSVTKIPNPKGVDSIWLDVPEFARDKTPKTARELFVNYSDPDSAGDCVRCFTRRNDQMYYPTAIFSDEIVNGKPVYKIGLLAGYPEAESSVERNRDSLIYFFPGDTVTLKWSSIDKGVYKFWNSVEFAKNSVGNPFSSPINLVSNISNGALGVWAGYGNTLRTLVVPN